MNEINEENVVSEFTENPKSLDLLAPFTPNNPPWNIVLALSLWFVSVALIVTLPSLFILPYLMNTGVEISGNPEIMNMIIGERKAVAIMLGATAIAHILTIVMAWFIVTKYNEYSFAEMVGWKWGGFKIWHGVLTIIAVFVVWLTLVNLFGTRENEMTRILESSQMAAVMVAIIATFSAPIVEEVVYRGVLYSAFQRTFNPAFAVIFVTVIFAGVHVAQYLPDYASIAAVCFLSLVITLIRAKTNNLLPCIAVHLAFNGIQSVLLVLKAFIPIPEDIGSAPNKVAAFVDLFSIVRHLF